MTPESGVLLALVITISICGAFTACVCCMCCCVASVWNTLIEKLFGRKVPVFGNGKYQNIPHDSSRFGYQGDDARNDGTSGRDAVYAGTASLIQNDDVPLVEAYVVPPLAASRGNATDAHTLVHGAIEDGVSSSSSNRPPLTPGAKDVWAAVIFVINVFIIFVLAIQSVSIFNNDQGSFELGKSDVNFPMIGLYLTFSLFLISAAGSYMVYFFLNHGEYIIDWVMKLNILGLIILACLSLITLQIIGAIIFGIMAGINMWYYVSVRNRIPFASSILAAACTAVKANFSALLLTAFSGLMFQGLWMLLWAIALFGVYNKLSTSSSSNNQQSTDDDDNGSAGASFVSFLMLFSLYWGIQLIKDVVAVTAGGTVATWWFHPKHPAPVRGSLFRATTSSFGSICFGSMFLALITTFRVIVKNMVEQSRRGGRGRNRSSGENFIRTCLLLVLESILRCLENLLRYINRYAYSYVAAYGYDFVTAGRSVMQLFDQRGWATVINDDLIANALFLFAFFMAVVGVLVGLFLTALLVASNSDVLAGVSASSVFVMGGVYGGLVGLIVGSLVVGILDSAVAMVFVCFAEDSNSLQTNHPETFRDLSTKWSLFQPPMSNGYPNDSSGDFNDGTHQNGSVMLSPVGSTSNRYEETVPPYHQPPAPTAYVHQYHPAVVAATPAAPTYQHPTVFAPSGGYNPHYVAPETSEISKYPTVTAAVAAPAVARPPPVNPNFYPGGPPPAMNNNNLYR